MYICRAGEAKQDQKRSQQKQRPERIIPVILSTTTTTTTTYNITRTMDNGDIFKYVGTNKEVRDNLESIADRIRAKQRRASQTRLQPLMANGAAVEVTKDDSCESAVRQTADLLEQQQQNGMRVEYRHNSKY